jgi:alpha-ribazole phosphatase/probable phosphoglycerate mutase
MALRHEIILVRHAETALAGSFCGESDPPLNARGLDQLPLISEEVARWNCVEVYSSDLLRAWQTAEAIGLACGVRVQTRRGLREISFGVWEGLTWKEVEAKHPKQASQWINAYPYGSIPQGEAYESFFARVQEEVEFLSQRADEGTIAVVTHAGVLRTILRTCCNFTDQDAWNATREYGSILVMNGRGEIAYAVPGGSRV